MYVKREDDTKWTIKKHIWSNISCRFGNLTTSYFCINPIGFVSHNVEEFLIALNKTKEKLENEFKEKNNIQAIHFGYLNNATSYFEIHK